MRRIVLMIPLFFASACARHEMDGPGQSGPEPTPEPTAEPASVAAPVAPTAPGEAFVYADVERAPAPMPARFAAPLPPNMAALQGDWSAAPPRSLVEARLCAGDPGMWQKLGQAVDAALAGGDPLDEVVEGYGALLTYCYDPGSCALAAGWVDGQPAESARAILGWQRLARCTGPAEVERFRGEGLPDEAVIEFWFERAWEAPPEYVPALAASLQRVAQGSDAWLARRAAVAHGKLDDPRVAADLLAAHAAATDPAVKDQLVAGMSEQTDPAVKAIFQAHCARTDVREAMCPRDDPREWQRAAPKDRPATEVLADEALRRRATSGQDYRAAWEILGALRTLATQDWAKAREAAGPLMAAPALEPSLRELVDLLQRFESREAIVERLVALGLLEAAPASEDWVVPSDLLTLAGRVHGFDCETGMYPNEHDALLTELAAMAGPPLAEVAFLEVAPPLDGEEAMGGVAIDVVIGEDGRVYDNPSAHGSYVLHAFTGQERLTTHAEDLGDWYDLAAVLGLLNTTARTLGQDVRFVTLPTGDQTALVLAAPPAVIAEAEASGLLRLERASAAAEDGKAFEAEAIQRMIEQIRRDGIPE